MAELVDALDSKSSFFGSKGSSPFIGIFFAPFYKKDSVTVMRFLSGLLALFLSCQGTVSGGQRPNLLWIMVDDLNDWVGCLAGHPQARTPNLDALAKEGVLFRQAYCSAPACNPSRTSLLFGVSPATSGVFTNGNHWRASEYLHGKVSLPVLLRKSGYETLRGGKIFHSHTFQFHDHSLFDDPTYGSPQPEAWVRAFPSWIRQMPAEVRPPDWPVETTTEKFYRGQLDWAPLETELEDGRKMADTQVVDWALGELEKERNQPFFMAVGLYRPHTPWYLPAKYFQSFPIDKVQLPEVQIADLADIPSAGQELARRDWHQWLVQEKKWRSAVRAYLASMSYMDDQLGRLLEGLRTSPASQNTIVILMSDHGYHLGEKEHWEKFTLWEHATRVPLVIKVPGGAANLERSEPVSLLDLYPTVTDLLSLPRPDHLEGRSVVPLLTPGPEQGPARQAVTYHGPKNRAIRTEHYRYIRYHDGSEELYDHRTDPREWRNLLAN